ncbi:MAG: transposase [Planctomycetes bacterium]|nr:transposase [Planctomycetota bacterium]
MMTDHAQQGTENPGGPGDPEVPEKPVRRRFDAAYKQRIVEEADACSQPGEVGLLLRREGLYASLLSIWRRQHREGALAGLTPKRRGRKAKRKDAAAQENDRLRRENERLARRTDGYANSRSSVVRN